MKNFLMQIILFILPILIVAYFADIFLSHELKKSKNEELGVWNAVFEGRVDSDVLIYGASRAMTAFDPAILSKCLRSPVYNLGISGHNFWLEYLRHAELLKYNKKPKLIILSVDMSTFIKRSDLYRLEQFLPYMLTDPMIKNFTSSYQGYTSWDYRIPVVRYFGQPKIFLLALKVFFNSSSLNIADRVQGYLSVDQAWNENNFILSKKKMKSGYRVVFDRATIELFNQFLEECREQHIQVVFVYAPEEIEGQNLEGKYREQVMDLLKQFSKKYQIPFYDYSNNSISFQKKYFYNAQHLNKNGAKLFSSEFCQDFVAK